MTSFSAISEERLATCHENLQQLVRKLNEIFPVRVMCGHRGKADQDAAVAAKASKTPWPRSKHNKIPSLAVYLLPEALAVIAPKDWNKKPHINEFRKMADHAFTIADSIGIHIRWDGDFHQDGSKTGTDAWDMPHIELVIK